MSTRCGSQWRKTTKSYGEKRLRVRGQFARLLASLKTWQQMQTERIHSCESCSAGSHANAHPRPRPRHNRGWCHIVVVLKRTRSRELYCFYDLKKKTKHPYSSSRLQSCMLFIQLNPVPQNWLYHRNFLNVSNSASKNVLSAIVFCFFFNLFMCLLGLLGACGDS